MRMLFVFLALASFPAWAYNENSLSDMVDMARTHVVNILTQKDDKGAYTQEAEQGYAVRAFLIKQVKDTGSWLQETENFDIGICRIIDFEARRGRFFRASILVIIASDLGVDLRFMKYGKTMLTRYLVGCTCKHCGKTYSSYGQSFWCCRCKEANQRRYCGLKTGHEGAHDFESWIEGPMPQMGSWSERIPIGVRR